VAYVVYMSLFWHLRGLLEPILRHPSAPPYFQLFLPLLEMIVGLILFMGFMLALQNSEYEKESLKEFLVRTTGPLAAEGLKALAITVVGLILFIVPGLVYQILFTFFPFVIFFDKRYETGELNALNESKRLIKPYFFRTLAYSLILFFIPFLNLSALKHFGLDSMPLLFLAFSFSYYFTGFSVMMFYGLYKDYEEKLCPSENHQANS